MVSVGAATGNTAVAKFVSIVIVGVVHTAGIASIRKNTGVAAHGAFQLELTRLALLTTTGAAGCCCCCVGCCGDHVAVLDTHGKCTNTGVIPLEEEREREAEWKVGTVERKL